MLKQICSCVLALALVTTCFAPNVEAGSVFTTRRTFGVLFLGGSVLMAKKAVGTRNKVSVFAAIDFTPSLLKLTGAKPQPGAKYDGEDVLDTLLGKSKASRKAPIFFSRPPDRKNYYGFKDLPDLSMRSGKWKFLCDYDGARPLLYDVITDPGETKNLAADHPDIVKDLTKQTVAWWKTMPKYTPKK